MNSKAQHGSSLISVMVMVAVILVLLASLLSYAVSQRAAAIKHARGANQLTCAESGIQLARTYFARNFLNWNTYLGQPNIYNPIQTSWNNPSSTPPGPANFGPGSPLRTSNPELFIDVDGDNLPDVYIYIRDNQDEFPPAVDNPLRDNDQNVIVGAICISTTMAPSVAPGQTTPPPMQIESILSYNVGGPQCTQAYCGNGAGNMNG
jgi:type II secretory pathway pseudopilin PulG